MALDFIMPRRTQRRVPTRARAFDDEAMLLIPQIDAVIAGRVRQTRSFSCVDIEQQTYRALCAGAGEIPMRWIHMCGKCGSMPRAR